VHGVALSHIVTCHREAHAVDTYTEFAESNKEVLQSMPAPAVAKDYYEASDLYAFDEFQTERKD
jgi:ubiquinol oxidase